MGLGWFVQGYDKCPLLSGGKSTNHHHSRRDGDGSTTYHTTATAAVQGEKTAQSKETREARVTRYAIYPRARCGKGDASCGTVSELAAPFMNNMMYDEQRGLMAVGQY